MKTLTTEKIAVYCRVSSEDQADRGTIEVQKDCAVKYIDMKNVDCNNIELYDYYCDDGISGTIPLKDRPEGARLLQDAANGLFDTVMFYKIDRLGRKTKVILDAIEILTSLGINIRSMTEPIDTTTPTGYFIITTLGAIAQLDRESILLRMHTGAIMAAKKGKWLGGVVPFGYITNKDGFLVINREPIPGLEFTEEDIVKIIFKMCANENKSSDEIADYINSLGVPTRYSSSNSREKRRRPGKRLRNNAALWWPSRVQNIIHSSIYKGYRVYGLRATLKDYEPIRQETPAIVDEELWERANQALSDRTIIRIKQRQGKYLLQGYIFCEHCGHSYCGTYNRNGKNGAIYYYRCTGRDNYVTELRCTKASSIQADWIEHLVLEYCAFLLREHKFMEAPKPSSNKESVTSTELKSIEKTIKGLAQEKDKILSLYRKNLISMADLTSQFEKIKEEEKSLEARRKELLQPTPEDVIAKNRQTSASFFKKFRQVFPPDYNLWNLSYETQREILHLFIDKVTIQTVRQNEQSFYESFNIKITDKLGNTDLVTMASTTRLQRQKDIIDTGIKSIGDKLRSLRLGLGFTQKQVADAIGTSIVTVNAFENTRRKQSATPYQLKTLHRFADFYGVAFEEIAIWRITKIASDDRQLLMQIRDVKGLSSEDVYKDMGISKPTFRKYLHGGCTEDTRIKIHQYLKSAKHWLKKLMQSR